jgi:GAF domain-containing protein
MIEPLIKSLTDILNQPADAALRDLMPALCEVLDCDRCFLYVRNPDTATGQITHCYSRSPECPDLTGSRSIESADITQKDPLMALAFCTPDAVFVDDIETASSDVVNLQYEQEEFGHRALIHAPIYWQDKLYGILEPCLFAQPRVWTAADRAVIAWTQEQLAPLVIEYLKQYPL